MPPLHLPTAMSQVFNDCICAGGSERTCDPRGKPGRRRLPHWNPSWSYSSSSYAVSSQSLGASHGGYASSSSSYEIVEVEEEIGECRQQASIGSVKHITTPDGSQHWVTSVCDVGMHGDCSEGSGAFKIGGVEYWPLGNTEHLEACIDAPGASPSD